MSVVELETERLTLRQWQDSDYPLFAEMNADPNVMAYFSCLLNKNESDGVAKRIRSLIASRGWGFWAVEEKQSNRFIGFVGLHEPTPELPFSPCVEIGWRLARAYWGKGYATEAAKASLDFAFEVLSLDEIYSFATVGNRRSRAVMERLGMVNTDSNFHHPAVPDESPLKEHVLYRLTRKDWICVAD